jgi:hypothetical protein
MYKYMAVALSAEELAKALGDGDGESYISSHVWPSLCGH